MTTTKKAKLAGKLRFKDNGYCLDIFAKERLTQKWRQIGHCHYEAKANVLNNEWELVNFKSYKLETV